MKNRLWLLFYAVLLAFLSTFVFFKIQERDLIIQLNNHNLSQDAYQVKLKQRQTLEEFENKITNVTALPSLQVHFQVPHKKITYFFGKGNFAIPPLVKGSFFSSKDLKSDVAVAVVGKDQQKKLYTPKDQSYLKYQGHYYPVLGVMGDKYHSALDQQIFFIPSLQQRKKLLANHFKIIIDGKKGLKAKQLEIALNVKATRLQTKQLFVSQGSWIAGHLTELLSLVLILAGFLVAAAFWLIFARQRFQEARFLNKSRSTFCFEEWESFALLNGLGMVFGILGGIMFFSISSYFYLLIFDLVTFLLSNFALIYGLKKVTDKSRD